MGRREKPIDDLQPFAEFANGLRTLRAMTGRPSLRAIADEIHYSLGYVSYALSGKVLPTWEFTSAYVQVCGGQQKEWSVRWEQARAARASSGAAGPKTTDRVPVRSAMPVQAAPADRADEPAQYDGAVQKRPADPHEIHNLTQLAQGLNRLRDGRSYAELDRAAGGRQYRRVLANSTLSDVLSAKSVPTPTTLMLFLTAAGVPAASQTPWLAALERVSTAHLQHPSAAVRVREADPRLLGVHASIQVDPAEKGLPTYVTRDVDAALQAALTEGRDRGGLVLLVGSSSSGKTRTLFEAVRAVMPEWWLLHPADAAAVRNFATSPTPRTLVWLDELQRYFTQPGGVPAGTIRSLLAANVLVVATLWPDEVAARVALPATGSADQYAEDRAVLAMAQMIQIPPMLSPGEKRRAAEAADDRRIRTALESADAGLTQVLAAGPELVRWWENAGSDTPASTYGKAIITAALDARRIGATAAASREFLVAAAPAYLTSASRAAASPTWFDQAIGYATTLLHGAAACLTPVAAGMGAIDGWVAADFLYEHARRQRRTMPVPDQAWQALIDHHRPEDTRQLAVNAERRGRWSDARRLWDLILQQVPAGQASVEGMVQQGRVDDLRRLADVGNPVAATALAELLVELGRVDEATETLRRPAETGDSAATFALAELLVELGRDHEAIEILRPVADADAGDAAALLADLLARQGRLDELRQRAEAGDQAATSGLIKLLIQQGNMAEAAQIAGQSAPDQGAQVLPWPAAEGYDAVDALRRRADAGDRQAALLLADLLTGQGRDDDAIELLRERADAGEVHAAIRLISMLAEHRRMPELHDEVQAGTPYAYQMLQSLATEPTPMHLDRTGALVPGGQRDE